MYISTILLISQVYSVGIFEDKIRLCSFGVIGHEWQQLSSHFHDVKSYQRGIEWLKLEYNMIDENFQAFYCQLYTLYIFRCELVDFLLKF